MKTAIFYFSGTGNTKRTADAWQNALISEGVSADSFRVEDRRIPDLTLYDRIGIFYPVHAFNAPEIVLKFAENLPPFPQEKAFFIAAYDYPFEYRFARIWKAAADQVPIKPPP